MEKSAEYINKNYERDSVSQYVYFFFTVPGSNELRQPCMQLDSQQSPIVRAHSRTTV